MSDRLNYLDSETMEQYVHTYDISIGKRHDMINLLKTTYITLTSSLEYCLSYKYTLKLLGVYAHCKCVIN